ncbi:MAG: hypothetical protein Q8N47_21645, partial [Bryobacterales bacterium]|nr:hypothetical protein [Bryobacterales bacterium]
MTSFPRKSEYVEVVETRRLTNGRIRVKSASVSPGKPTIMLVRTATQPDVRGDGEEADPFGPRRFDLRQALEQQRQAVPDAEIL